MKLKSLLLSAAALSILSTNAFALDLANNDTVAYGVEIIMGEGDATNQKYDLKTEEVLTDVCMEGCTIKLSNGTEQGFAGDEIVSIKDGEFVIAE